VDFELSRKQKNEARRIR